MSDRPNIWKQLQVQPKIVVRSDSSVAPPVPDTLAAVAAPKPEVPQVEPQPIPDRVVFAPMHIQFRRSLERPGLGFVEIAGARYYGGSIRAALGQAVIEGAFGLMDIEMPEGES